MNRDTVGKISGELSQKPLETYDPVEQTNEQLSDYDKNIEEAVQEGLKKYHGDFYIAVLTKKERLMQNIIRHYFIPRQTCPTPEYDQTVYKYNRSNHSINYLWTLPDKQAYYFLLKNADIIPVEQRDLLQFVIDDVMGKLLKKAKLLNGEKE